MDLPEWMSLWHGIRFLQAAPDMEMTFWMRVLRISQVIIAEYPTLAGWIYVKPERRRKDPELMSLDLDWVETKGELDFEVPTIS